MNTDVEEYRARENLVAFESLYETLRTVTRSKELKGKVRLVVFDRTVDYRAIGPSNTGGYFSRELPGDADGIPALVFPDELEYETRVTYLHELGHRFNHTRFYSMPRWLDEGLAEYDSTLDVTDSAVHLGGTSPRFDFSERSYYWSSWFGQHQQMQIPASHALTIAELTAVKSPFSDPSPERVFDGYASAWKLVQMLRNGPRPADGDSFERMLTDMEAGASGQRAFADHFGGDGQALEQLFRDYLTESKLRRQVFEPVAVPVVRSRVASMSDAEVHVLWAMLTHTPRGDVRASLKETELALASDPHSTEARYVRAVLFFRKGRAADALGELDKALARAPDEPRYLALQLGARVVQASAEGPQGHTSERAAKITEGAEHLARAAKSATELAVVAAVHLTPEGAASGLPFAEQATRMDPLCVSCFEIEGEILGELGRLDEAERALGRALTLLQDGDDSKMAEDIRASMAALAKRRGH